jgi:tripeptide aminopeptidase
MGAEILFDKAAEEIGSQSGNLVAKFKGPVAVEPLLLSAHMDTVEPGRGIKPMLEDGVFTSDGTTILGADDKSAIAILLEVIQVLLERKLPHSPIELVLSVCEEIGLVGAKHLDFSLISAPYGYVLDSNDTQGIVTQAPSANHLEFEIYGKDAHAGASPERGINAILLASRAISGLNLGRIDDETTANIGIIEGGLATNIVPKHVTVKGEVRSHDDEKLKRLTDEIVAAFQKAIDTYEDPDESQKLPRLDILVESDFTRTFIPEDHPVVQMAFQAAANLGRNMRTKTTGGGADANIFFKNGIITGVLGTGMRDMHSTNESIRLDDMVATAELLLEIIQLHAKK